MKKLIFTAFILGVLFVSCVSTKPTSLLYKSLPKEEKYEYERLYEQRLNRAFVEVQKANGGIRFRDIYEYQSWEAGMAANAISIWVGSAGQNAAQGALTAGSTRNPGGNNGNYQRADGSDPNRDIREYYRTIYKTAKYYVDENFDSFYERQRNTNVYETVAQPNQSNGLSNNKPESKSITHLNRGRDFYYKGKNNKAIKELNRAIDIDENLADAYYYRAAAYNNKKDYDRAIADYNQVLRIEPNDAWAYHDRGIAYYNKGNYDRAIADFEASLKIDPDDAETMQNLADARQALGL